MTSVENIQKVNVLAQELLKKHMANDIDEALTKAQQMLGIDIGPSTHINPIGEKKPEQKAEGASMNMTAPAIDTSKFVTKKDMQDEISKMKEVLNASLNKLYEEMKKLVHENAPKPSRRVDANVEQIDMDSEEEKPVEKAAAPAAEKPAENFNPRTGGQKPGDAAVDIKKIFYFGNK